MAQSTAVLTHPKTGRIRVSIRNINPDEARTLLQKHTHVNGKQRGLNRRNLDRIDHALRTKQWCFNGEAVVIGPNGEIIDGRHRLTSSEKAGIPLFTLVVDGVKDPKKAFDTTDGGTARSIATILGVHNHRDQKALAAAIRLIYMFQNRLWQWSSVQGGPSSNMTALDAVEIADKHPGLKDSLAMARDCVICSRSLVAGLHYLCSLKDDVLAMDFFEKLITGEGIKRTEPVYTLRRRLEKERIFARQDRALVTFLILRTWNATRMGEQLIKLQSPRKDSIQRRGDLPEIS